MLNRVREFLGPNSEVNVPADVTPSPNEEPFELGDFPIDDLRPMRVIAIGAGISGILAGIRFRQHIPNVDITIYEKEDHIGGTWYVNRYPGVACDVPAPCYQYTFEKKTDWSALYSPGSEILAFLDTVVEKHKLEPYIKLRHELIHARYEQETGKWHVRIKRPSSNVEGEFEEFDDVADFLFMGVGILSRWSWPKIEGLKDFKGTLVHSANWNLGGATWQDDVKDWGDKNVAVIGLGSTSLQITSALQTKVGHLSQYARGKAWVSPPFAQTKFSDLLSRDVGSDDNYVFTEEEKKSFTDDPARGRKFRLSLEDEMNSMHSITMRDTPLQINARALFKSYMVSRLASKPEIAEKLIPDFSVTCRRLSPAPGYLEALAQDHVAFVTTPIRRITPDGIETEDGDLKKQDVIICATGFDLSFRFPFPVIGRDGVNLYDKWTPLPKSYLSVCIDEFPNFFFACGPNSVIGTGSLLPMMEHQVEYAVMAAQKLQRERLKSIEVKADAVDDFDKYVESYFPKTVFSEKVRTWYKMSTEEGRVVGLWPGSSLHALRALKHPRWEDFNYERVDSTKNRLNWLGNGMTLNEQTMTGDRAWYLRDDYVDYPPMPA